MKNKIYLFLRYLIIISIILGLLISKAVAFEASLISLVFIFIINNQLRFFIFHENDRFILMSIIIEWILGTFIFLNYGGILLFYFIIGVSDIFFMLRSKELKYIAIIVGIGISIYSGYSLPLESFLTYIVPLISIGLISFIIKEEYNKNEKTKELYHKLRQSENELIKTNRELNEYSKSLKDLTLLKERNRISREIHDSVGHSLSTIIIQLAAIEKITTIDGEKASTMLVNLQDFAKNGLNEIRNVLKELKPKDLSEYELILGIENLVKDFMQLTNIHVNIRYSINRYSVTEEISLAIYRAVQEFLSNSAKHGDPTKINIFLNFEKNELIILMKDNGVGTDELNIGMGLTNLTERVKEVNGNVRFKSQIGKGFTTRIVFKGGKDE